jgi:hypothetical protein
MAGASHLDGFKQLLATAGLPELGPGPRANVLPEAKSNDAVSKLIKSATLPPETQELVRGLILLWHDHLDAAHGIAQEIENADGSFLHGIVHRREPDYGNAKYWFRRVGRHASFPEIARRVMDLPALNAHRDLQSKLAPHEEWDAFAFIDLCEQLEKSGAADARVQAVREIQGIESEVLLEHWLGV